MFTVYILKEKSTGKHYIGSTNDVPRRLSEHNRHHTKSTAYGNWELIYTEEYNSNIEARRREKLIKSYKGGNAFKKLIKSRL